MLKTKIRFCSGNQFNNKDKIEEIIDKIELKEINFNKELESKAAFHCNYKIKKIVEN